MRAALAIEPNDLISGTIEIATVQAKPEETGPQLTVPADLAGQVTLEPYKADGYVGQTVRFTQLSFDQLRALADSISTVNSRYKLNFRRSGDIVSLAGVADLSQLRAEGVDVQLKIAFPGPIGKTNGALEMDNTISWKLSPGRIADITATAQYNAESGMSWTKWVLVVGAGAVGTALIVLALALFTHRRSRRKEQASQYA
nr:Lipoprotein LppM [Kibdelosporangium sp. MJ126-NF4]